MILPSKVRELDIETIDMLVVKNKDFSNFIKNISKEIKENDKENTAKEINWIRELKKKLAKEIYRKE